MTLDWNRITKKNIYDALYISDGSDEEKDMIKTISSKPKNKRPYEYNNLDKNIKCHKSYKNSDNNVISSLEKDLNNLCIDKRNNNEFIKYIKKPRNLGCGIYD